MTKLAALPAISNTFSAPSKLALTAEAIWSFDQFAGNGEWSGLVVFVVLGSLDCGSGSIGGSDELDSDVLFSDEEGPFDDGSASELVF